jgi:hypothetical protein
MSTPSPLSESDKVLAALLAQPRQTQETPEEGILREIREQLSGGALPEAQHLATTLRTTTNYPGALITIAETQHARGELDAAHQTLREAQQHLLPWDEGDSRMGYPRAYYLLELVRAQIRLGDVAGATLTAQAITIADYQRQAQQALAPAPAQNGG